MRTWAGEDHDRDPGPGVSTGQSTAAERGQTLKQFFTEALEEKLAHGKSGGPGRMQGSGALRRLRKETARIQARSDETFETVGPEDRL